MQKLTIPGRILVYLTVTAGALLFCTPFFWMMSTALKPIDQTMSMPPRWLPFRYEAMLDGRSSEVRLERRLDESALIVRETAGGARHLLPAGAVRDGQAEITDRNGGRRTAAVTVLGTVPAGPEAPWCVVSPAAAPAGSDAWTAIPAGELSRYISFRWKNFANAIRAMGDFPSYLKNTLLLCLLTVTGTVISSALAAYGFSRIEWKGRDKLFLVALATMMIPFPVVMVPLYCLFRALGLIGTLQPLWIGSFCAGAFNVFLLRQFFRTIPQSLSDAARIDGCSELQIFLRIILPMSKPAMLVVALFQFMGTWNDFLGPLLYLTDQKDFTLALGLQAFQSRQGGTEWNYLMAASAIVILPVILLFFFTQRTFIEGIATTGIKE